MQNLSTCSADREKREAVGTSTSAVGQLRDPSAEVAERDDMKTSAGLVLTFHPAHLGALLMGMEIQAPAELLAKLARQDPSPKSEAPFANRIAGGRFRHGPWTGGVDTLKVVDLRSSSCTSNTPGHTPVLAVAFCCPGRRQS